MYIVTNLIEIEQLTLRMHAAKMLVASFINGTEDMLGPSCRVRDTCKRKLEDMDTETAREEVKRAFIIMGSIMYALDKVLEKL